MSTYLVWVLLSMVTGSPLGAAITMLVGAWVLQKYALPTPISLGWFRQRRRAGALERLLEVNPHDRSARFELAELLVARGAHRKAVDVLRPCLERDRDDDTLFVMGVATYGAGNRDEGEQLLSMVGQRSPEFRQGAVWLELGRGRLAHGDAKGACEALERFVQTRMSTIEGRYLLARAQRAVGDSGKARTSMREAWLEYSRAPKFQKRRERAWAYRANPVRLAAVVALVLVCICGAYVAMHHISQSTMTYDEMDEGYESTVHEKPTLQEL